MSQIDFFLGVLCAQYQEERPVYSKPAVLTKSVLYVGLWVKKYSQITVLQPAK
jgi:hypothetical protein